MCVCLLAHNVNLQRWSVCNVTPPLVHCPVRLPHFAPSSNTSLDAGNKINPFLIGEKTMDAGQFCGQFSRRCFNDSLSHYMLVRYTGVLL